MKLLDRTKANTYKVASSGAELAEGNLYHFGYINEQKRMIGSRGVVYKRLNDKEAIIKTKSEISYAEHFIDFGTVYGEEQDDNNLKEYLDIMIMNESEKTRFTLEAVIFEKARIKKIEDKIKRLTYKLSVQSNKKEFPQIKKQIEQLKVRYNMMNFDETKIRVLDAEDDDELCDYAAEQIRAYLKTFGQLPKDKQVFTHPNTDCYYIHIDIIDPIENMISCFVDFSAS